MRPFILSCAVLAAASFTALPATAIAQAHHGGRHRFQDAEAWAKKFDDPKRDAWQKPAEVIQALQLKPDAVVADISAGTGYFATKFARAVPAGRVFAVDAEPDMVKYLGERAKRENLPNLSAVAAGANDPRIPEKTDLIILVNTYHHIDKREHYFRALQNALKPGGRVAVVDFTLEAPEGPPPKMRIAPERVKKEMQAAGYALTQEHGFLPRQYFLVFEPARP
ncbi:MAG: methyltransferase domain-containing protein [Betaproteobacteria bacterium]|nr:methyltransferase domain-containing protein [Betaproteobacteria bacterium]